LKRKPASGHGLERSAEEGEAQLLRRFATLETKVYVEEGGFGLHADHRAVVGKFLIYR